MQQRPILFFDSGIGGLTVLREAKLKMPERQFVYIADDAAFPYGAQPEAALKKRVLNLFQPLLQRYNPALTVIACNTASTLVLNDLRRHFPNHLFVGTVPAIKPAAEHTRSGLISVLATPGTVKRAYTHDLIGRYAQQCHVRLVGSKLLAGVAEDYLRGKTINETLIRHEIVQCFVQRDHKTTDIVVLACTHYPFLINVFRKLAPWPVDWLDPAEAIANRARSLLPMGGLQETIEPHQDLAYFTSQHADFATRRLLQSFGLNYIGGVDISDCSP